MLILSRKVTQTFAIGPDIKVVVLGVNGKQVRIGIAPKDVDILREEIADRIKVERATPR